jgi:chaperone BCS1
MLMLWTSSQSFAQNARSSLVTTNLASALNGLRNDANKKTVYYTPWNGRFFMRYQGRLLVFRRYYQATSLISREEVSISCFGKSSQILKELLSKCHTEFAKLVQGKTCLYKHQDRKWIRFAVSKVRRTSTVIFNKSREQELLKDIESSLT